MKTFARIAPQRKLVQWFTSLILLVLPFVTVGGESLFRLDAASRTLLFFGASLRIEEFYLFLLAVLVLLFIFLFITMVFGRVWCGWFCPQTTITDLAEWLDRTADRVLPGRLLPLLVKQFGYLLISFIVAANLVWYFIPPPEFYFRLMAGNLGMVAGIALGTVFLLLYGDLILVGRVFCKTVCPYGRIQLLTMDRNTLTLEFDPSLKHDCISCGSCERVCPMGIDIKAGLQIECINCGRCLDACREIMAKRSKAGLIHYTFGSVAEGGGRPINGRSLLLGGMVFLLSALLAAGIVTRTEATIKVQRGAGGEVRLMADGSVVNFYTAYLENRSTRPAKFTLDVAPESGRSMELIGPVKDLEIAPNTNRKVDFVLRTAPVPPSSRTVMLRLMRNGTVLTATPVLLQIR
jgi:cytochrome c oxidase accessory protein FixG